MDFWLVCMVLLCGCSVGPPVVDAAGGESSGEASESSGDALPPETTPAGLAVCGQPFVEAELVALLRADLEVVQTLLDDALSMAHVLHGSSDDEDDRTEGAQALLVAKRSLDGHTVFADCDQSWCEATTKIGTDANGYVVLSEATDFSFTVAFAHAVDPWREGELVPHHLFRYGSYASNIHVLEDTTVFPPTATVSYDPGPLHALTRDGLDVLLLSDFELYVELDRNDYILDATAVTPLSGVGEPDDLLELRARTGAVRLEDWSVSSSESELVLDYAGTRYVSADEEVVQTVAASRFTFSAAEDDADDWSATVDSIIRGHGLELHGFSTGRAGEQSSTEVFCDADAATRVGVLLHQGAAGTFELDDGTLLRFF